VAVGPSVSDPRTGEILLGTAIIPQNWVSMTNGIVRDQQPRLNSLHETGLEGFNPPPAASLAELLDGRQCSVGLVALEQAAFGFEVMAARGDMLPGSPEAKQFVADLLKWVVMHEVGHALGLRHNFRGSTSIKFEQLRDAAFTRQRGISNSVMDYVGINIPLDNEAVADYHQTVLGNYDRWAIEYAYREIAPDKEAAELARIAARSATDPSLAYATDEDVIAALGGAIDPLVNQWDLGEEPLAYYKRSMLLAKELWTRTKQRELAPGDDFTVYRRNLRRGLGQFAQVVGPLSRYVGGVHTSRQLAGYSPGGLFTPVPVAQQREALNVLTREVFSSSSFRFDPVFMSKLGVDHLDRFVNPSSPMLNTDFSLASSVLSIQRTALDQLMGDGLATRLADAETKVADRRQLLSLAEVHARVADTVWSELKTGAEIDSLRRNLQREHARRVATGLVRPSTSVAADVRAVNRQVAVKLQADLQRAQGKSNLSATTRAHLAETSSLLAEALKAPMVRSGV
jgi:predicted Zn-dependent protease with MMP-like domain